MPSRSNCSRVAEPRRYAADVGLLLREHEGDPATAAAGAPGATDAMDVALVVLGRVVVDDVRDVRQVEAAGGDVRGDQRRHLPRAEAIERPLACALGHVAVHRDRADVPPGQPTGEPVGSPLRPDEDEREPALLLQLGDQRVDLAVGRDLDEAVVDDLAAVGVSGRSTEKRAGLRVNARASTPTSPSSVAEKSIV